MKVSDAERILGLEETVRALVQRVAQLEAAQGVGSQLRDKYMAPVAGRSPASTADDPLAMMLESPAGERRGSHGLPQARKEADAAPQQHQPAKANPSAELIAGSRVRVNGDKEEVIRQCQTSVAGWRQSKEAMLGRVGTVTETEAGVARVRFNGGHEVWFPVSVLTSTPALRSPPGSEQENERAAEAAQEHLHRFPQPASPGRRASGTCTPPKAVHSLGILQQQMSTVNHDDQQALGDALGIYRNVSKHRASANSSQSSVCWAQAGKQQPRADPRSSAAMPRRFGTADLSLHPNPRHEQANASPHSHSGAGGPVSSGSSRRVSSTDSYASVATSLGGDELRLRVSPKRALDEAPRSGRSTPSSTRTGSKSVGAALAGLQKVLRDLAEDANKNTTVRD
ncbi:hypothetical protein DIPPA_15291 [Diplonema papillatum]|nr:hypothetical protein DIPPA_15291 [Diplonema papillatum]